MRRLADAKVRVDVSTPAEGGCKGAGSEERLVVALPLDS